MNVFEAIHYRHSYESWYRICNRDIVSLWWLLIRFVRNNMKVLSPEIVEDKFCC